MAELQSLRGALGRLGFIMANAALLLPLYGWLAGGKTLRIAQLAILELFTWHFYQTQIHPRFISGFRALPRAKTGWPLIGHGYAAFAHPRGHFFRDLMDTFPNAALIYLQGFWQADHLLLANSEAIFDVMFRNSYAFEKPAEGKGVMSRVLGDAIFIADGEAHRRLRKLLQPLYRFPDIKAQYAIFWSKGIELNTAIEREAASIGQGRLVVSMSDFATRATTDAVGQIIMGRDLRSLEKSNELLEAFLALVDPNNNVQMALTALEIFIPNWLRWLIPGGVERRVNSTGVRLRYFCDDFLQSRRREIEEQGPGNDLYTQIIRGGVLSDQELVDNLRETFAAGIEPAAKQFLWILAFLAEQQGWQARLRAEIRTHVICVQSSGELVEAPWDTMPILNAVLHEAVRMVPVTPVISRVAAKDTTILDTFVPKGTKIFVSSYAIHHSRHFYGPNADTFDPGRWIDDDGQYNKHGGALDKYAFAAFGHGTRTCLGAKYVMAELRTFVVTFVKRFELQLAVKGQVLHQSGVLAVSPREGLNLELKIIEE